jgi:prolyl oligopeptidase
VSDVYGLTPLSGDAVLFANDSYVEPKRWYRYDPNSGETRRTAISTEHPVSFDEVRVEREFAESKDGTRVPVNIIIPSGTELDGRNPIVVTGYGGFGVARTPSFRPRRRALLEQGVLFAEANLRGGGEYGERWHRQGRLTRKQNVFDDFAAVLEHLIERGYTSPGRIGITGGSNGGLLMGAVVTQHPELAAAVTSYVGVYDCLRSELTPNGAFNIPEFGTVKDAEQFRALYAYSPYHNVSDGVAYPPVLLLTGANDPRVDPMHSRKMTARLQAANGAGTPILLRASLDTGHGAGTPLKEAIRERTDAYAFLIHHLGVTYRPVE